MKISSNYNITTQNQSVQKPMMKREEVVNFFSTLEETLGNIENISTKGVPNPDFQKLQNIEREYTNEEIDELIDFFNLRERFLQYANPKNDEGVRNLYLEIIKECNQTIGDDVKFMNIIKGSMKALEQKNQNVCLTNYWGTTEYGEYYYNLAYYDASIREDKLKGEDIRTLRVMISTTKEPYAPAFEVVDIDIKDYSLERDYSLQRHSYKDENFKSKEITQEKPILKDEENNSTNEIITMRDKSIDYMNLARINKKYNDLLFDIITKFFIEQENMSQNKDFKQSYHNVVHLVDNKQDFNNFTSELSTQDIIESKQTK